jgi:thioredoxin reductase
MTVHEHDLLIVGSGPAGLAAAAQAVAHGLRVAILDEQARAGGQILRQPPREFRVSGWLAGRAYEPLKQLLRGTERLEGVEWHTRTSVLGLMPASRTALPASPGTGFDVVVAQPTGTRTLHTRRIVLASGCYELAAALPGATLAGVMTAGAIQTFLKSQQYLVGEEIFFCGTHPLQILVADQVVRGGGRVAGVAFAQPAASALALLRHPAILARHAGRFAMLGAAFARLRLAGVPVLFGQVVTQVEGTERARAVQLAKWDAAAGVGKRTARVECDAVGLCFGFFPQSELARQLGADCAWDAPVGGWAARHDEWMRSSVGGLYVAGEVTGVAGAEVSRLEGALAGLAAALDAGRISHSAADQTASPIRRHLVALRGFARLLTELSSPAAVLPDLLTPQTVICRCENVTFGELNRTLQENPDIGTPRAAKLATRVGMGQCQGRACEHAVARLCGVPAARPAREAYAFAARFPARPVRIGDLE